MSLPTSGRPTANFVVNHDKTSKVLKYHPGGHQRTAEGEFSHNFKRAYRSITILRREKSQNGASCDKNSDKSLHRPQVELGGR